MANIDIDQYIEQSGMRKARFGGYEPEDVRQVLRELCTDYEQSLADAATETRAAKVESEALRRRCQTLIAQNQSLTAQNATLAARADKLAKRQGDTETRYNKVQERNHSLSDQVAVLRLKNSDLTRQNKELSEHAADADAALRIKGRAHDEARQKLEGEREQILADARAEAEKISSQAEQEGEKIKANAEMNAKAIESLAREQATAQARKMVQAATDESREIQNAYRLRLQDLRSRIAAAEQRLDEMTGFLTQMIDELRKDRSAAEQNGFAAMPEETDYDDFVAEPQLDFSEEAVAEKAEELRANAEVSADEPPLPQGEPSAAQKEEASAKSGKKTKYEIPGTIFSAPIVHPEESVLDIGDDEPLTDAPHTPVMPEPVEVTEEDTYDPYRTEDAQPLGDAPAAAYDENRRRKVVAALRALDKCLNGQ